MKKIILATLLVIILGIVLISPQRMNAGRASATHTNSTLLPQDSITLSISDASLVEGNAGSSNMIFTVTLTGTHNFTTVHYATADGSPPSRAIPVLFTARYSTLTGRSS